MNPSSSDVLPGPVLHIIKAEGAQGPRRGAYIQNCDNLSHSCPQGEGLSLNSAQRSSTPKIPSGMEMMAQKGLSRPICLGVLWSIIHNGMCSPVSTTVMAGPLRTLLDLVWCKKKTFTFADQSKGLPMWVNLLQ